MATDIEKEIRTYITQEVLEIDDDALPPGQPLLAGLLDSFCLMALLSFIEDRFEVTIKNDEVLSGNFQSVERLAEFVTSKLDGSAT